MGRDDGDLVRSHTTERVNERLDAAMLSSVEQLVGPRPTASRSGSSPLTGSGTSSACSRRTRRA
jgi:hypothetical protein